MTLYRCTNCGKKYNRHEYDELKDEDIDGPDPDANYGIEKICEECGNLFHTEKWHLVETVETDDGEMTISTVGLTIPHGPGDNKWFETMIQSEFDNYIARRYQTKEEAEEGHEDVLEKIENGEYSIEPIAYQIRLDDD